MCITVQTCYDIQYLTMRLSGYMNAPTEPVILALKHGMEYHMQHPHEPIMYSRENIHRTEDTPHQCYFNKGDSEIGEEGLPGHWPCGGDVEGSGGDFKSPAHGLHQLPRLPPWVPGRSQER